MRPTNEEHVASAPEQPKRCRVCLSLRSVSGTLGGGCQQCKVKPVLLEKGGCCKPQLKVVYEMFLGSLKEVSGPFRGKNNLQ